MITAIILARWNSTRFEHKNFLLFHGIPLIKWTIEAAVKSKYLDKIIISTDSKSLHLFSHPLIEIDNRPEELAKDETTTDEVIHYLRNKYNINNTIVLLQPTSPLRTFRHINEAIELFWERKKSVISVNKYTYEPNGAIYIFDTENVYDGPFCFYEMEPKESIDIDFEYQFRIAESLMEERLENV